MPDAPSDVRDLVFDVISELNRDFVLPAPVGLADGAALAGEDGPLDSVLVVTLLASLEEQIEARFKISVPLLEEPAMLKRDGPLTNVGALIAFLTERIAAKSASPPRK